MLATNRYNTISLSLESRECRSIYLLRPAPRPLYYTTSIVGAPNVRLKPYFDFDTTYVSKLLTFMRKAQLNLNCLLLDPL
jgi:hypothetical protein